MIPAVVTVRARQASQLGPSLTRVVSWPAVALAGAVGTAAVIAANNPGAELARTRLGAVGLAASLALVLDDPAAVTLASSPTSLRWRRTYRVALAGTVLVVGWLAVLSATSAPMADGALTVELMAFAAVGLSAAVLLGGIGGAISACLIAGLSPLLATRFRWWPLPGSPLEPHAVRPLLTLALAAAALVYLWSGDRPRS